MALCVTPAIFSIEIQGISYSLNVKMNFCFYKPFFLTIWKPILLLTSWFVCKNIKMWWLFKDDVNQSLIILWYYISFMLQSEKLIFYFNSLWWFQFWKILCESWDVSEKVYCLSRLLIMNNRNQTFGLGSRIQDVEVGGLKFHIFLPWVYSSNLFGVRCC